MIARTSCSRTSNEMSVSALTPPKRSEMFCNSRTGAPMACPRCTVCSDWVFMSMSGGTLQLRRFECLRVADLDVVGSAGAPVQGVEQRPVAVGHRPAPDAAHAGEEA